MNSLSVRIFLILNFGMATLLSSWLFILGANNTSSNAVTLERFATQLRDRSTFDIFSSLGSEWFLDRARISSQLAASPAVSKEQMSLYCASLAGVGRALRFRPWDPALLVGWASAKQLLARSQCDLPFTEGNFEQALELGLLHGAASPAVIYNAALVEHWASNFSKRNQLLRRFLESAARVQPNQVNFIASILREPRDILQIFPARFPQITLLSEVTWPRLKAADSQLLLALEKVQLEALSGLQAHNSMLSIIGLYPFVAGDGARRRMDTLLSSHVATLSGAQAGQYLALRSGLSRIPIVTATLATDRRPLKSQFYSWNSEDSFVLDQTNASIGFFLPRGASPRLISLEAADSALGDLAPALDLFVSTDNLSWTAIVQPMRRTEFVLSQRRFVGLELIQDLSSYRYLKLRFNKAQPQGGFVKSAVAMATVYGSYAEH